MFLQMPRLQLQPQLDISVKLNVKYNSFTAHK